MEVISVECPFCGKSLKALHRPPLVREKKKSSWGGSRKSFTRDEEILEILEDCTNCGKSKKEIENALKHGKELTNEEIIKRMKEAGLPLKIKG
jgi:uncharacterized Zn finger protein